MYAIARLGIKNIYVDDLVTFLKHLAISILKKTFFWLFSQIIIL